MFVHLMPTIWCLGSVFCAGFFVYKLVRSLRDKAMAREEKKKLKQQRREKEMAKKTKKK